MSTKRKISEQGWIRAKRSRECYLPGLDVTVQYDASRLKCVQCEAMLDPDAFSLPECMHSACPRCYIDMIADHARARCECGTTSPITKPGLGSDLLMVMEQTKFKLPCGASVTGPRMRADHVSCCSKCMVVKIRIEADLAMKKCDILSKCMQAAKEVNQRERKKANQLRDALEAADVQRLNTASKLEEERRRSKKLKEEVEAGAERESHWLHEFHSLWNHLDTRERVQYRGSHSSTEEVHESAESDVTHVSEPDVTHVSEPDDTHVSESEYESDDTHVSESEYDPESDSETESESENAQLC